MGTATGTATAAAPVPTSGSPRSTPRSTAPRAGAAGQRPVHARQRAGARRSPRSSSATDPDVLLVNEFDYVEGGEAAELFRENYLEVAQNGARRSSTRTTSSRPSTPACPAGFDLNNNGTVGGGNDAFGLRRVPRPVRHGRLLEVPDRRPTASARSRSSSGRTCRARCCPTTRPRRSRPTGTRPRSSTVCGCRRRATGTCRSGSADDTVHFLVSPPDAAGLRRRPRTATAPATSTRSGFWADYVRPAAAATSTTTRAGTAACGRGARFVIAGDQNSDPLDGDSVAGAIQQLLDNPRVNARVTPSSERRRRGERRCRAART